MSSLKKNPGTITYMGAHCGQIGCVIDNSDNIPPLPWIRPQKHIPVFLEEHDFLQLIILYTLSQYLKFRRKLIAF